VCGKARRFGGLSFLWGARGVGRMKSLGDDSSTNLAETNAVAVALTPAADR